MERLQIKVKNLDTSKYKIACNKYEIFLHDTDEENVKIAGLKFKAWDPVLTLHPGLKINSPLTFDIYDIENGSSIGGCKYHVFHQGGKSYDTTPINVNEAEGRMLSRFEKIGHTKGKFKIKQIPSSLDFSYTTDLRRISDK
jgi:uncharacterized protein (DUF2126 family)